MLRSDVQVTETHAHRSLDPVQSVRECLSVLLAPSLSKNSFPCLKKSVDSGTTLNGDPDGVFSLLAHVRRPLRTWPTWQTCGACLYT